MNGWTGRTLRAGIVVAMVCAVTLGAPGQAIQMNPVSHIGIGAPIGGGTSVVGSGLMSLDGAPATYDLRNVGGTNYVTSVKDQGSLGSCWTFATYGSMESNILRNGGATYDLSENHLVYHHGFDLGPNEGGHIYMSSAYLSRLSGPCSEADDPYGSAGNPASPGGDRQRFLRDMPIYDTTTEIKNAVMSDGALHTSMYWDAGYYRSADYTYYNSAISTTNHAVDIVGWDDNKATAAPTNGAWLIKNSWGTGWGDSGYFWISYADVSACDYGASFQSAAPETVQGVYYHDEFGNVSSLNSPYGANVFHTGQGAEEIGAVGFWTEADGASYDVKIYDAWSGGPSGSLLASETGTIDTQGFHVIDLDSAVTVDDGDFVVVLNITNGGTYMMAFDYAVADYTSTSTASAGESYYSFNGSSWTDLTTWNSTANFSIKAYVVPEPATMGLLVVGAIVLVRRRRRA